MIGVRASPCNHGRCKLHLRIISTQIDCFFHVRISVYASRRIRLGSADPLLVALGEVAEIKNCKRLRVAVESGLVLRAWTRVINSMAAC